MLKTARKNKSYCKHCGLPLLYADEPLCETCLENDERSYRLERITFSISRGAWSVIIATLESDLEGAILGRDIKFQLQEALKDIHQLNETPPDIV